MMQVPNMFLTPEEWAEFHTFLAKALRDARNALREAQPIERKGAAPVLRYSKRSPIAMRPIRRHEVQTVHRRKGRR